MWSITSHVWSTTRVMYFMWSTTTGVCLLVYHYSGSDVSVWSTARVIYYVWCTTRVLYYSWSSTRYSISHMLYFIKSRRLASGRILGLQASGRILGLRPEFGPPAGVWASRPLASCWILCLQASGLRQDFGTPGLRQAFGTPGLRRLMCPSMPSSNKEPNIGKS